MIFIKLIETAKSSEKDTATMEATINEIKEKLSQEQETCKRLQDDLSSYTERELKMSQSITSVNIFSILVLILFIAKYVNNLSCDTHIISSD